MRLSTALGLCAAVTIPTWAVFVGPPIAKSEPTTLGCHQDAVYTPKLPEGVTQVDVANVSSDSPGIVTAHAARKGGGTDGSIELQAMGHTGSATITYEVYDAYTGFHGTVRFQVAVDCGGPRRGTTGGGGSAVPPPVPPVPPPQPPVPPVYPPGNYPRAHYVQTNCDTCRELARRINVDVDKYNALVDGNASPTEIGAALSALRSLGQTLNNCEKACHQVGSSTTGVMDGSVAGGIGVTAPVKAKPNPRGDDGGSSSTGSTGDH